MNDLKQKALDWHKQGQLDTAKKYYIQYLKLNPQDTEAHHALGVLFSQLKQYQEAISEIQQAISLDPHYAAAYNNLGNVYFKQEKLPEAENAYTKAIEINPSFADGYCNLGILHAKLQHNESAIQNLQNALKIKSNQLTALRQLSDLYLRLDRFDEAIILLKQQLHLTPNDIEAHYRLGVSFYHRKQYDNALHEFQFVLNQNKQYDDTNQYIANTLLQTSDYQGAINYYHRQLSVSPTIATYYNIGFLLMMQNKYQDALTYLLHAEKLDPHDVTIQLNIAHIYLKQKKISEAIFHYRCAQHIKPEDKEIQHILSALTQDQTPNRTPVIFLQHLFDQYANYYDKHLMTCLQYTVPEQLFKAIETDTNEDISAWTIIDLGCGTGLSGALFKPHVHRLIGIDISEKMLEVSKFKGIYDELILGDIENILPTLHSVHCIIAADVLTYFGQLISLFNKVHNALLEKGIFAFTVEKTTQTDYVLQTSIRYAHHKQYIQSLVANHHFDILRFDSIVLRKDQGQPIDGYLIILRKNE